MADELKAIYEKAGKIDRYFEDKTPVDLWRGQKRSNIKKGMTPMHPDLEGFTRKDGTVRQPDVKIYLREHDGATMVKGCCGIHGDYRGVSTFGSLPQLGAGFEYYSIPKDTEIPNGLAVTKDEYNRRFGSYHYTFAPTNDMPLSLFLVWLKVVEENMNKVGV